MNLEYDSIANSLYVLASNRDNHKNLKTTLDNLHSTLKNTFDDASRTMPIELENSLKFCLSSILESYIKLNTKTYSKEHENIAFIAARTSSISESALSISIVSFIESH